MVGLCRFLAGLFGDSGHLYCHGNSAFSSLSRAVAAASASRCAAAAAAAALCGIPSASMAALAMRNSTAVSSTGQLLSASPYLTAANPLVRKLLPTAAGTLSQKVYGPGGEEMMIDSSGVMSQPVELGQNDRWVLNRI